MSLSGVLPNFVLNYFWLIAAVPAGMAASAIIGCWAYFLGGSVLESMLGAFIGMVASFLLVQIIHCRTIR